MFRVHEAIGKELKCCSIVRQNFYSYIMLLLQQGVGAQAQPCSAPYLYVCGMCYSCAHSPMCLGVAVIGSAMFV